jgi:hypothetical protein
MGSGTLDPRFVSQQQITENLFLRNVHPSSQVQGNNNNIGQMLNGSNNGIYMNQPSQQSNPISQQQHFIQQPQYINGSGDVPTASSWASFVDPNAPLGYNNANLGSHRDRAMSGSHMANVGIAPPPPTPPRTQQLSAPGSPYAYAQPQDSLMTSPSQQFLLQQQQHQVPQYMALPPLYNNNNIQQQQQMLASQQGTSRSRDSSFEILGGNDDDNQFLLQELHLHSAEFHPNSNIPWGSQLNNNNNGI